jgi:hypothetical protein
LRQDALDLSGGPFCYVLLVLHSGPAMETA